MNNQANLNNMNNQANLNNMNNQANLNNMNNQNNLNNGFNNVFDQEMNIDDDDNRPNALQIRPNQDNHEYMENIVNTMINDTNNLDIFPEYTHIRPSPNIRNVWQNEHTQIFNTLNQPNRYVFIGMSGDSSYYVYYSQVHGYVMIRVMNFEEMDYEVYQVNLNQIVNWFQVINQ
jgi:hypothetical protein